MSYTPEKLRADVKSILMGFSTEKAVDEVLATLTNAQVGEIFGGFSDAMVAIGSRVMPEDVAEVFVRGAIDHLQDNGLDCSEVLKQLEEFGDQ